MKTNPQCNTQPDLQLKVDETKLVQNLRHAFTRRSNVISELMQNARRAGATEIRLFISEDHIMIDDNGSGSGIEDFSDLLTVASSGWDAQTVAEESPFGLGFLAALYACQSIQIESRGTTLAASTEDILKQKMISLSASSIHVGTRIALFDHDYPVKNLQQDIFKLAKGFPVTVYLNDEEVPRPHAIENLKGVETELGFFHLKAAHDLSNKATQITQVYLQGLPIRYDEAEVKGAFLRNHFTIPFGTTYGSDHAANVIHLDSKQFIARVPDRDVLIDSKSVKERIADKASQLFLDILKHDKSHLSGEAFVSKWWEFVHSHVHLQKDTSFKALFIDIEFVPSDIFSTVTDYPYVLRPDDDGNYMELCETGLLSKQSLEEYHQLLILEPLPESNYEASNAIAYLFAYYMPSVLIMQNYENNLHKDHWLHECMEEIDKPEEQFRYDVLKLSKTASFNTGSWTDLIDFHFCESCEIEHIRSGRKAVIDKDAFVLPDYQGVVYPEKEQSGVVVTQLNRFVDEWDSWREDEQEDEDDLLMRFVLSERADKPEILLQQLLNSVQAGRYSALLGKCFTVDVAEDGKLDISV